MILSFIPGFLTFIVALSSLSAFVSSQCDRPRVLRVPAQLSGTSETRPYQVGETVTYVCSRGYTKESGDGRSTCEQKGGNFEWSEPNIVCNPTLCATLHAPAHGRLTETDFSFGKEVSFECNEGYEKWTQSGMFTRTCQHNGQWSGLDEEFQCRPIHCKTLVGPSLGSFNPKETTFGTEVTFTCDQGFKLIGKGVLRCTHTGEWDHPEPTCDEVMCDDPDTDEFKTRYINVTAKLDLGFSPGEKATFSCDENTGISPVQSTCTELGDWFPQPPDCSQKPTEETTTIDITTDKSPSSAPTISEAPLITNETSTILIAETTKETKTNETESKTTIESKTSETVRIDQAGDGDEQKGSSTTPVPNPEKKFPSWVYVLITLTVFLVIALVVLIFIKRKINKRLKKTDEKTDAEMESLANYKASA